MNLASQVYRISALPRKHIIPGLVLLSSALASCGAIADLNHRPESSIGQSVLAHRETNSESDQRFLALFRTAPLSLTQAIAIA